LVIPASLADEQVKRIQNLAIRSFKAIDGAGLARVDFLLDLEDGEMYLNEINTLPGFTSISMYPKLWAASGIGYPELVDRLVQLGLERKLERDQLERIYHHATESK
jgi:D-alanine-D-alanine ligase